MALPTERQLRIIEATGQILSEKGLGGLTTKNLAAKMGFSESALYRHFKTKNDVLVMHVDYLSTQVREQVDGVIESPMSAQEALHTFLSNLIFFLKTHRYFADAMLGEGLFEQGSSVQVTCLNMLSYVQAAFVTLVHRGWDSGELKHTIAPEAVFHAVMGAFRVLVLRWKWSGFTFDLEEEGGRIMGDVISRSLGK